ncbi:hypothetical protein FQN52_003790 [Onygenales sp. PD_12]|nr:hypothetical protein FQN52_003790 [Onygenales sp. PD_12]
MTSKLDPSVAPDTSQGPALLAVTAIFLFLALLCYTARMYVRIRVLHYPWWDDWIISVATLCAIVEWALVAAAVQHGFGRPHVDLSPAAIHAIERLVFFFIFMWGWAVTLVKISVSLMMLRIKNATPWRICLGILIAVQALAQTLNIVVSFLQCRPYYALWNPEITGAHCWSVVVRDAVVFTLSAIFVASDIICSLLPLWFIYQVPRPLFEKITFVALTSLGLLASAAALAKVVLLARVSSSDGGMWTEVSPVDLSVWTNVEECLGIAAASIPVLKPMLDRVLGRLGVRPQAYGTRELRGT